MSTLLAIIATAGIIATMRALLKEDSATVKCEVESARLAFNAKMRASNAPGYWPTV